MTKITLLSAICVWHCVVNGQLAVNNFPPYNPYYIPYYTSTVIPTNQNFAEMEAQLLGGTDELGSIPNMRNSPFQGVIFLQIKRLQATTANLAKQLKDTTDALKATQAELITTKKAVSDLNTELQTTKTTLDTKAAQADLVTTNKAVSDLTTELQTTKTTLDTKAAQADLLTTNQAVDNLKTKTSPNSIGTVPTSCDDLKTIGFVKSGIYSVMSNKQVQNVYCDFNKSNSAEMQKLIGTVDVKSTAVYFHAQMSTPGYSTINTAVPLDLIKFNVGNAYSATGIFVAPTVGNYYFAFSGISDNNAIARVVLQVKSGTGAWTNIGEAYGHTTFQTFSLQSSLQLLKDDQVRLYLTEGKIHDSNLHYYTNFDGWLIQEKELTV